MGMDNLKHESKKSKGRGASNVARSLDGLGQTARESGCAEWNLADSGWMLGVVAEVTKRGGLVSFGLSRDRGAYSVTILLDGDRRVVWVSCNEEISGKLEEITHFIASLPLE